MTRQQQQQIPAVFEQARDAVSWLQVQIDLRDLNQGLLKWPWEAYHRSVELLHAGRVDRAVRYAELALNTATQRLAQINAQ